LEYLKALSKKGKELPGLPAIDLIGRFEMDHILADIDQGCQCTLELY
tara:strand:+ start:1054 stop:1194 length:141 start_codon:yes stop_codon:yes gene_type:complete